MNESELEQYSELGANLKKARKELGVSGAEIARQIGCSKSTITGIDSGRLFGKNLMKYMFFLARNKVDMNEVFNVNSPDEKR